MEKDEPAFLSIKEFASLLGVHQNTIRRAIKNGHISAFRVGFGKKSVFRIARSEINRIALIDLEVIIDRIIEKRMKKNESAVD